MTHPFRIGLTLNKNRIDTLHVTHYSVSANAPQGAA